MYSPDHHVFRTHTSMGCPGMEMHLEKSMPSFNCVTGKTHVTPALKLKVWALLGWSKLANGPRTGSPQIYDNTARKKKTAVVVNMARRPFAAADPAKKRGMHPTMANSNGNQKSLSWLGIIEIIPSKRFPSKICRCSDERLTQVVGRIIGNRPAARHE